MRKIFTFYLFLLSFAMSAQKPIVLDTNSNNPGKKNFAIRIRCQAMISSAKPLWIVDGVPLELENFKNIDPDDIASIDVLKDAAALALFGCRAMNGVIIITTKSSAIKKIQVVDNSDGSSIPAATISFISGGSRKDTLMLTTNDSGVIRTDKLSGGKEYKVSITSAGYKNLTTTYNTFSKTTSFTLERNIVNCIPVVVTSRTTCICRRIICCRLTSISNCELLTKYDDSVRKKFSASIYPNPVQKGRAVTIEIESDREEDNHLKITSIGGQQLLFQKQKVYKGENRLFVNVDSRWATGVYFVQLSNEKGIIIKQEKIIIQ